MTPDVKVGGTVVVNDRHLGGKFRTPYEREVWEVVNVRGTMVMVHCGQATVSQNVSWFKRVPNGLGTTESNTQTDDD